MIVMKFGGASVEDAPCIDRVIEIINSRLGRQPVVVVSAMGKTTRRLLQAAESSASGDSRTTLGVIAELKTRHVSEARRLIKRSSASKAFQLIDRYFEELKKLLEGLAILGDVPPRALDKILSYGELLSAAILSSTLAERGIQARLLDAREVIKTDDRYGSASPIFELTNQRVRDSVLPAVEAGLVPVLQGFIGTALHGATTTLGFEGSDYTAAIVGAAIDADEIQIWKTVSGLMTADPAVFKDARTVKRCSFTEAAELTYNGAKVLHPKAVYPAAEKNIPVRILNSKEPGRGGTLISSSAGPCTNLVKSITYKSGVTFVHLAASPGSSAERNRSSEDLALGLIESLSRRRIESTITVLSASNVMVALDSGSLNSPGGRYLLEEISSLGSLRTEGGRAIISIVGEELTTDRALAVRAFQALDRFNIGMIFRGASPMTMSFAVSEDDVEAVIASLHKAFFSTVDPGVFE
jgi:aspartate kinase